MRRTMLGLVTVLTVGLVATPVAWAIAYASGIQDLGGGNYSFVLNQSADDVRIVRYGDTTLYLGALPAGTHVFNLGLGTGFEIVVTKAEPLGWAQFIADGVTTNFFSPLGVAINKNPASPNFGKVYISNASGGTTGAGRVTLDGVYMLLADASDAGFATGGVDWVAAGTASPFKCTIGPDDHLYVADFSRDLAWEFSSDMLTATQLIDASNKSTFTYGSTTYTQYVESIHVEGTQAGGDREIYLVDSNYYAGNPGSKGLIRYTLGANPTATPGDLGTQYIGPTYFTFYPRDVARDAAGDWYMNQYRFDPNQAAAVSKFLDAPPPINTADWETPKTAPFNGAYGIDVFESPAATDSIGISWVAYGNYYDGFVHIFNTSDGSYVTGFDAGTRLRELAFDIVGNLVTVDNVTEYARFWSPGGEWQATTRSDGTFALGTPPAVLIGDLNCDGLVGFADINPFVLYLSNNAAWQIAFPGCNPQNGDINEDGLYPDFGDINPFVQLLSGGF